MEQIYTILINEIFEYCASDGKAGCPVCMLHNRLEDREIDSVLGAAMMEPDVRIRTNEEGFCRIHYDMMLKKQNRLGMALTLESHLTEIEKKIRTGVPLPGTDAAKAAIGNISALEKSCYVCKNTNFHFERTVDNIVALWENDETFASKFNGQSCFCLPHYKMLLVRAKARLPKKRYAAFVRDISRITEEYMRILRRDVSHFCRKFDYRFGDEPWYDSKDAIERAIRFLRGDLHNGAREGKNQ